eukprot:CAMPEP_0175163864 /NCGR_PEP_ID=MMETSP0087-20121206/26032_1 /TAXON_ID=136419 /ORGANISM="Unknown Unknown, Strain D1" /LENGTH=46 /DNA_ID= /DNA_START= /DNA_END= /DNA_ORIENTATION=
MPNWGLPLLQIMPNRQQNWFYRSWDMPPYIDYPQAGKPGLSTYANG